MNAPAMTVADGSGPPVLFNAVLHPHRSLGRRGFAILMAAVALVSLSVAGAFYVGGAWPIAGLYGLDLAFVFWAFRVNYRHARRRETVRLTPDSLTVERHDPGGARQSWSFQPYWLTVSLDEPPGRHSRLTLSSHGRSLVVGSFLSPDERQDFARALRAALARARQPGQAADG